MSFDSWIYALFLPTVWLLYVGLGHRAQNRLLLLSSWLFYGYWDWRFLGLLVASSLLDWGCALRIEGGESPKVRRRYVTLSVLGNLSILGFFKYADFFLESLGEALARFGLEGAMPSLRIVLPVGISFYTFQTMSYTLDVYRQQMPACRSLLDFSLYVSFFPQLVAGPIERASRLIPQIQNPRVVTNRHLGEGAWLILFGLFKKVALADAMAREVNLTFGDLSGATTVELWRAVYLFTFQIYCDFSGYSDIARGSAKLLGFDLMVNFRQPFLASSLQDLWRRWHVSLSSWLRDYVYVPLGGSRGGAWLAARNLLITFTLSGLWHGAQWNYVLWGLWHGVLLVVERCFRSPEVSPATRLGGAPWTLRRILATVLVFHWLALAFVLFRAPSLSAAMDVFRGLWPGVQTMTGRGSLYLVAYYAAIIVAFDLLQESTQSHVTPTRWPWPVRGALYAIMILFITAWSWGDSVFIYFQF